MIAWSVALRLWRAAHLSAFMAVFWLSVAPIKVPSGSGGPVGVRPDMLIHLGVHAVLGALAALAWGRAAGFWITLWLAVYLEAVQISAPGRSFSADDLVSNMLGGALGVWAAQRALTLWRAPR